MTGTSDRAAGLRGATPNIEAIGRDVIELSSIEEPQRPQVAPVLRHEQRIQDAPARLSDVVDA